MFLYNKQKANELLNTVPVIQNILAADESANFICPYDKLIVCSNDPPTPDLLDLVRPARFHADDDGTYYRFKLIGEIFSVQWGQVNPQAPTTSIMLNPWKQRLTPDAVLALIDFIIGDHHNAYVVKTDDKVDWFHFLTSQELAKRLYVGYQKKPPQDYKKLGETYMHGSRKGQQVRNYDKAKEQRLDDVMWTRVEKPRIHRDKHLRQSLLQFLLNERADALKHTTVVDISEFNGNDRIMRRIKKYGTFQEAFMSLDAKEKRKLKRHEAFQKPLVDVVTVFKADLDKWMSVSANLYLLFRFYSILQASWGGDGERRSKRVLLDSVTIEYPAMLQLVGYGGKNKWIMRDDYLEGIWLPFGCS
ncbi:hypothetical protein [Paenibacillus puerhi]|uniref:hypothetical protein n=1 Tax=Paenibacillus puerhi TaxID=2692622 RepID=UPI0013592109|nr:hypothetical protein [Paenibacillus puerhi]